MLKPYDIIDDQWVKLNEGPYAGIIYRYGRVRLLEEHDTLRVSFEYETQDGTQMDSEFGQYIGPILTELIEHGLIRNSIVYTGGIDESRNKDPS